MARMQTDWKREILGSIAGAIAGATIAQLVGAHDAVATAAIAGAFAGPGVIALVRRTLAGRRTPPR